MKSLRWMLVIAAAGMLGCGPQLSRQDLGQIVLEPSELPAFNQPYNLPIPRPPKSEEGTQASPGGRGQMPRSGQMSMPGPGQMPMPPAALRGNAPPGEPPGPNTPN